MKNFLSVVFSVTFIFLQAQYSGLDIEATQGMWAKHKGFIDNMEIEVTPDGHRARVEMTFTVHVDSINRHSYNYSGKLPSFRDNLLEARMNFKMPEDAFFYDSYLWLNPSTIIRAKLLPRGEANWVYDSIVNRKIDPSILQEDWNGNYSLKIFPISTIFSRKVKLAYSVPFEMEENGREFVQLPQEIFKNLNLSSSTNFTINHKPQFKFKHLVFPLSGKIISETNSAITLEVKNSNLLSNPTCYLEYQNERPKKLLSLFYQKLNVDESFYDLRIYTKRIGNLTKPISSFGVKIPLKNNGFVFQAYNNNNGQLNHDKPYIECGNFFGDIDFEKEIELKYKLGSNLYSISETIDSQNLGNHVYQNWAYNFSKSVSNAETQEVCLKYRVLNKQTAFLALENGDTVTSTKGNEMVSYGGNTRSGIINQENNTVSIYPNPIVSDFTIENALPIISIRIIDISGRLIYSKDLEKNTLIIELNSETLNMKRGIYWIIVEDKSQTKSFKVIKE